MTRFAQALFLTLLAALFPASAVAQNLLVNGNFDTDVSSWVNTSSTGTFVFSPLDANGSASSGSMLTTNTESTLFVRQCRPATAGTSYDFGGKARIPLGQVAGQYFQQLNFFTNTTCTGSGIPQGAGGLSFFDYIPSGAWQGRSITGFLAPPGTVAALISVSNQRVAAAGTTIASFDDLFLSKTGTQRATLTVAVAASIHGANNTFFHSDAWIFNRSFTNTTVVTLVYRCFGGSGCGTPKTITLAPRESRLISDIVGTLFGVPESGGAIELSWDTFNGQIAAQTRLFTPSSPPSYGFGVPAEPSSAATARAVFLGVAGTPALTGGFRTNAGAYNPNSVPVTVTFTLYDGTTGAQIGSPFTRVWGPFEAAQVSNVTASLGAGSVTTANAILVATSSGGAVFFYGATVDNLSGDSFLLTRSADEVPVP